MKKIAITATLFMALAACQSEKTNKEYSGGSMIEAEGQSEAEIRENLKQFEIEERERLEREKRNVTSLKYDRLEHDFGDVKSGTDNKTTFKVTNTGDMPLIISDVKASCGCTTPKKPQGPIEPGGSDVIEVNFHPNPGQGIVTKTVTVTANTNPKITELKIKAKVLD